jgi:two-component system response regulator RegX3
VHVKRLRSRIEEDPAAPQHITTVRGVGYRFDAK